MLGMRSSGVPSELTIRGERGTKGEVLRVVVVVVERMSTVREKDVARHTQQT
jgi:hypothetical protein